MFGLSGGHLLILSVIVLLFGSKRLPGLGSALGSGIREFKKGLEGHEEIADKKDGERIRADSFDDPTKKST